MVLKRNLNREYFRPSSIHTAESKPATNEGLDNDDERARIVPVKKEAIQKSTKGPAIKDDFAVQTTIDLLTEPATETTESTEQTATDKKAAKVIKFSKSAYEKISIKKKIKKKPKRL
jgi:transcription termination factor Rho